MRAKMAALTCIALGSLAGLAIAQSTGTYVSGLLHQPLGGAVLTPLDDRRLAVTNIGSSGQDGVEVLFDSIIGGGMSVDISPLLGATGVQREIRIRPKGWDGTIKGNVRVMSDPDGLLTEEYDFSDISASALRYKLFGAAGEVLAEGVSPGPILGWGLHTDAPLGVAINKFFGVSGPLTAIRDAHQGFFDRAVAISGLTPDPIAGVHAIEVSPEPCAGLPENCPPTWVDLSSMLVTCSGLSDFVVSDAGLHTLGVHSSGVGQAHLTELRESPTRRLLRVDNLGSSGQDGVSIELHPVSGVPPHTVEVAVQKGNCCRGHVIIMKLYDDEGREQRVTHTQTHDPSGIEELDADFASLGASGYRLTLFDASGALVGPPGGLAVASGSPKPQFTSHCPPGQVESWTATTTPEPGGIVVIRRQRGCTGGYDFTLPGHGAVNDVASFRIEPLGAGSSFGDLARCAVTGTDDEGLIIEAVSLPRAGLYASGLLHQPLGGAEIGPALGRRLPVHNLGSSGEDGVSLVLDSYWGGSSTLDLTPLLESGSTSRTIRIRPRGWDGLIYGNHRVSGSADGLSLHHTCDFSSIGAESVDWALVDVSGAIVDQGNVTGSSLEFDGEVVTANPLAPPGLTYKVNFEDISIAASVRTPVHRVLLRGASSTVTSLIWSPRSNITEVRLTPRPPAGSPPPGPVVSLDITGSGVSSFALTESTIGAFGAECFAEHLDSLLTERLPEGAYPPPDRWLEARTTATQQDVSVAVGQTAAPGSLGLTWRGSCCRGHVIIMKAFDDEDQEVARLIKTHDEVSGQGSFAFDCSAAGSTECDVELFDSSGASLAVVRAPNGATFTFADANAACPADTDNEWQAAILLPAVQKVREIRCSAIDSLALPSGDSVSDVKSYVCTPVAPLVSTSGRRQRLTATATYSDASTASLVVTGASFLHKVASDLDDDFDVDATDLEMLAACASGPAVPYNPASLPEPHPGCILTPDVSGHIAADLDQDGDVDQDDFGGLQRCYSGEGNPVDPNCTQ